MSVLESLAYSGPVPVEILLWKSGSSPSDALSEILRLQDRDLVAVSGISASRLQELRLRVHDMPAGDLDAAMSAIHDALGDTDATIELTTAGLRAARAVV
jgi:hypothetical protein